ncbi:hypothetical protein [Citrobacter werkmanii]|uniref:hypothetical protein n=1 Tax=Citrobacter werkmanii TaxID=67827 RepID=UPI001C2D6054|nr:hypothetical protein [Citrobacter werkmanii]
MSNINKQAVQAVADLKAGYTLGHADVAILNELARIALASLEAEAVAWLLSGGGAKNNVSFDSGNAYADPLREVTPLYTATPAPVSVPDEVTAEDCPAFVKYDVTDVDEAWARGFNACRAAMLKHSEPFIVTSDHRMMEMPQVEAINAVTAMLQGVEPVTTAYKLPANVIGALEKALQAMSFMGDTLNEMDAVCEEDVEYVTPAFEAVRKVLDGGSPVIPGGLCPCCGRKQLKSRTCSVAGCEGKHVAHGFCKKHYDIERKKDPSRRESIRSADERYRARKSAASQQEVKP